LLDRKDYPRNFCSLSFFLLGEAPVL
jgi:hypothetical protein